MNYNFRVLTPDYPSNGDSSADLRALVLELGKNGFASCALQYARHFVRIDHLSLFAFDHQLVPHLQAGASIRSGDFAISVGKLYEKSKFYRHDPNTKRIGGNEGQGSALVFLLRASAISNPAYREQIYVRHGLIERLSLLDQVAGRWIALNLYRDVDSGSFTEDEIQQVQKLGDLLVGCAGKHVALVSPVGRTNSAVSLDYLERLLLQINPHLTPRERQVCARALTGMTVCGTALELDIKETTVATLKHRAYAKCNISSLNELFALCLMHLL